MKFKQSLKTALWGLAGFIISFSFLTADNPALRWAFGYILFTLSALMFILAGFQLYKDNIK